LDRFAIGVLLFGDRGQVVFANRSTDAALKRKTNGLALRAGNPLTDGLDWLSAVSVARILQRELQWPSH
jgi:hypothetical protein